MNSKRKKITIFAIILSALLTIIGFFIFKPQGDYEKVSGASYSVPGSEYVTGEVVAKSNNECMGFEQNFDVEADETKRCEVLEVLITSGAKKDSKVLVEFDLSNTRTSLNPGTKIQVLYLPDYNVTDDAFLYMDLDRSNLLIWTSIIFSIVTILIGRWRGAGAIVGLFATFFVLIYFLFPAILEGKDPVMVAVVASSGLVLTLLYVAHGLSIKTSVAILGTLFGIFLTAIISYLFVTWGNFSGVSSDEDYFLAGVTNIRLDGLLLAGIIFAAVGVLNDVTVTQASAVWELKESQPNYTATQLFVSGMRIGRDHIASTVYTLLFTYAGAALPTLILISISDRPGTFILSSEGIAQEIIRTLVGSICLVLAVPITTALAAVLAEGKVNKD